MSTRQRLGRALLVLLVAMVTTIVIPGIGAPEILILLAITGIAIWFVAFRPSTRREPARDTDRSGGD